MSTRKSRAQLIEIINQMVPDNQTRFVSAANMRRVLWDVIVSDFNWTDDRFPESASLEKIISQTAHGFSRGIVIRESQGGFVRAIANNEEASAISGIVTQVIDANTFRMIVSPGFLDATGLSLQAGKLYYLSENVSGAFTQQKPVSEGDWVRPLLLGGRNNTAYFLGFSGYPAGGGEVGDLSAYQTRTEKNQPGGYAGLDDVTSLITLSYLQALLSDQSSAGENITWSISRIRSYVDQKMSELIEEAQIGGLTERISQVNHGFATGNLVRDSGTAWVKSIALQDSDTDTRSEVYGIVTRIIDANTAEITTGGFFDSAGLNLEAGKAYFLSQAQAGEMTDTAPTAENQVHKAVVLAARNNRAYFVNFAGQRLGTASGGGVGNNELPAIQGQGGKVLKVLPDESGVTWAADETGTGSGPANTDALAEGATNLYFTQARARAAIAPSSEFTYNAGALSINQVATSKIAGLDTALSDRYTKSESNALLANKASLVGGKVPASELPSYVDDILEFANLAAFPAIGEGGKIYVALDTNIQYRWSGSAYVAFNASGGAQLATDLQFNSGDTGTAAKPSQIRDLTETLANYTPASPSELADLYYNGAPLSLTGGKTKDKTIKDRLVSIAYLTATQKYDVRSDGAKLDGNTNDYAAIMATLSRVKAKGGGDIFLPSGVLFIGNNEIVVDAPFVGLIGSGRYNSVIRRTGNGNTLTFGTSSVIAKSARCYGLGFVPAAQQNSGAGLHFRNFSNMTAYDLLFDLASEGVKVGSGSALTVIGEMEGIRLTNYNKGIWLVNTLDIRVRGISSFAFNATSVGAHVDGGVEGCHINESDFIGGDGNQTTSIGLLLEKQEFTTADPSFNKFSQLLLDSHATGLKAVQGDGNEFVSLWASCRERANLGNPSVITGGLGVDIGEETINFQFIGGGARICGLHGVVVRGKDHVFSAFAAQNNNLVDDPLGSGFVLETASVAQNIDFIGCSAKNTTRPRTVNNRQRYGIFFNSGADNYSIIGGDFSGNVTAPANTVSSSESRIIIGVRGIAANLGGGAAIANVRSLSGNAALMGDMVAANGTVTTVPVISQAAGANILFHDTFTGADGDTLV